MRKAAGGCGREDGRLGLRMKPRGYVERTEDLWLSKEVGGCGWRWGRVWAAGGVVPSAAALAMRPREVLLRMTGCGAVVLGLGVC